MKHILLTISLIFGATAKAKKYLGNWPPRVKGPTMRHFALILMFIAPTWAVAEYTDERFTVKGVPLYVNIMDDAKDGCWTNIGEVRTYIEDKLAENGAEIVKETEDAGVVLNFHILGRRTSGFCYGSLNISLNVGADVLGLRVIGSLYRRQAVDIEPQNFNIMALTWLGEKLKELD